MSFYYYAVISKYKLLIRLGCSHYDRHSYDELVETLSYINLDKLSNIYGNVIIDMLDSKIEDIGKMKIANLADVVEYLTDTAAIVDILNDEARAYAIYILFGDCIEDIIPETELEKYKGWTVID